MNYKRDASRHKRQQLIHIAIVIGVVILGGIILFIDITTGWWGETVILSGMAAGLVTYLVTSLVVDRLVHSGEAEQWSPVTRLAITNILLTLTDDATSESMSEEVVPRSLDAPQEFTTASIDQLSQDVVAERDELSSGLAKWASFLAAAADVQGLMISLADAAQELDDVRVAINKWRAAEPAARQAAEGSVRHEVDDYNNHVAGAVAQGQEVLSKL